VYTHGTNKVPYGHTRVNPIARVYALRAMRAFYHRPGLPNIQMHQLRWLNISYTTIYEVYSMYMYTTVRSILY
jgi:hypothetical protein